MTDETWNNEDDAALAEAASSEVVEETPSSQEEEYLKALQQLQADFENYKKRVVRSSEAVSYTHLTLPTIYSV